MNLTDKISAKLIARLGDSPQLNTKVGKMLTKGGVCMSPELARILALPRRPIDDVREDLTPLYIKNPDKCGVASCPLCIKTPVAIWPKQSQMLWEAWERNGLFAPSGVGSGKTLPSVLLHQAMDPDDGRPRRTVLLLKPRLREKLFNQDLPAYRRHFHLPPVYASPKEMRKGRILPDGVYVVSFHELSQSHREGILDYINPDLVVADEAHLLRVKGSARTKRFRRFMDAHPECRFCGLTGSALKRSQRDSAHLYEYALKKDSPIPRGRTLFEWCTAIDPNVESPIGPGKLLLFCQHLPDGTMESARDGVRRRTAETPGVVATQKESIEVSFELRARKLKLSPPIQQALDHLETYWEWDGEEHGDALGMTRVSRQLCCGFYYKWRWPGGSPSEEDRAWLAARNAWNKEVREYLKYHSTPGRDTMLQLWNAAERGEWASDTFEAWKVLESRPKPPTDTVWLDSGPILNDVKAWCAEVEKEDGRGIIWFEHLALEALFREGGIPTFGAGNKAAEELGKVLDKGTTPFIACSQLAHATGINMQRYNSFLVTTPPAAGDAWQQQCGRVLRPGQMAEEVVGEVYQTTERLRNSMKNAFKDARYLTEMTEPQWLILADKVGFDPQVIGG